METLLATEAATAATDAENQAERLLVWAFAAKLLLGRRRREAYTEAQLARKAALERRQAERTYQEGGPNRARVYLLRAELADLMDLAGLSEAQRRLIVLTASGCSTAEIARNTGAPRTSVASRLARAQALVRRARSRYPFAGLYEIYDMATRRRR